MKITIKDNILTPKTYNGLINAPSGWYKGVKSSLILYKTGSKCIQIFDESMVIFDSIEYKEEYFPIEVDLTLDISHKN